jgi:phospholipase C
VIIMQENRSFNNIFEGFPGATTASQGTMHDGTVVPLATTSFEQNAGQGYLDLDHGHVQFETAYDGGKMDGFDLESAGGIGGGNASSGGSASTAGTAPYAHLPQNEVAPYWTLASNYVLYDHLFEDVAGPSFNSHQYMIAAQSGGTIDNPTGIPWGCDAPAGTTTPILQNGQEVAGPFPCFTYPTLADELDAAGVSWRYYAPTIGDPNDFGYIWSAYDAIHQVRYGPDWSSDVISPETTALTDFASGNLPSVAWVVPSFANSDHAGLGSATGPQWVANLVNAIGESPAWNSTVIFIAWDDAGGWYDPVPPPQVDQYGLGFRVPLICVSPFAKKGVVDHTVSEIASTAHFIEDRFGLPTLTAADARANDLSDCLDTSQSPRAFQPLSVRYTRKQIIQMTPRYSSMPPDTD